MFAARLNSVRASVGLLLRYATLVGPAVEVLWFLLGRFQSSKPVLPLLPLFA